MRIGNTDHVFCDISELGQAIGMIVNEYANETKEAVSESVVETTKEASKIVKENAPIGRRKKYHRSIRNRIEADMLGTTGIIYASGHEYSLTHLLEKGHELWNSPNRTRAFPHFKKGERYAIDELPKKIVKRLKG